MHKFLLNHGKLLIILSLMLNILFILVLILLLFDAQVRNKVVLSWRFIYFHIGFIANVVKILGIFSIIFVYLNYKRSLRWKRFDYSIDVINDFRSNIIPHIEKSDKQFYSSIKNKRNKIFSKIGKHYIKDHPDIDKKKVKKALNIIKSEREFNGESHSRFNQNVWQSVEKYSYCSIINEFEELAIYDAEHIIDDNLAYREMHAIFLRFFRRHKWLFHYLSGKDTPYFACHYLIKHWIKKRRKNIWLKSK